MALPHLPTSHTTRKNLYEAAIVNRRIRETDLRQKWSSHADYFHRADVAMTKHRAWESEASFEARLDLYLLTDGCMLVCDKEKALHTIQSVHSNTYFALMLQYGCIQS